MEDERDSADILRSTGSDPSGSHSGFKLSDKLRARMENLSDWRIRPSSIKAPEDARQFHGGHATVTKAFLLDGDEDGYWFADSDTYDSKKAMQLCRQFPESDDRIRGAADHRRGAEGEFDDDEEEDEEEHTSNIDGHWWGKFRLGCLNVNRRGRCAVKETEDRTARAE
ncbi:hypothetical protein FRC05_002983 [Tulasnella sp. 425]|nr:hypothetical protein FRC05_002983 [Tulasnella sp. 425]